MNSTSRPWRYTACANMNFLRQGFRRLSSDRHTDRQTDRRDQNCTPRRFAGGQWSLYHLVYYRILVGRAPRWTPRSCIIYIRYDPCSPCFDLHRPGINLVIDDRLVDRCEARLFNVWSKALVSLLSLPHILDGDPSTGMPTPEILSLTLTLGCMTFEFPKCLTGHIWSRRDLDLWPFHLKI